MAPRSTPSAAIRRRRRYGGVRVDWTEFSAYVLGGCFYGAAGVFISAQTGSGDPLVGDPMLLPIFAAVVVGGTLLWRRPRVAASDPYSVPTC